MFRGVIPILQTPFTDQGVLDLDSLRRQVDFVIASGADAMAYPGFVSEWWKLDGPEILAASKAILEQSAGRVPVILNVTMQSTYLALEQATAFAAMGASGLMCLPPFVVPRGSDALLAHLRAILSDVPLPHILQYSTSLTGLNLEPAAIRGLREEFPHFSSIKVDFIPPGPMISRLIASLGEGNFTYLIGFAGLQLFDSLARGAHGLMGGAGHTAEDVACFTAMQRDFNGDGAKAFRQLLPLLNLEMQTIDQSIATHKHLLHARGVIASPHVRVPGPSLDRYQIAELRSYIQL
jgi:dihydrodipicolinate synthase/N-acetylneuraminate lyase